MERRSIKTNITGHNIPIAFAKKVTTGPIPELVRDVSQISRINTSKLTQTNLSRMTIVINNFPQ